jgi:hypothetical protein
VPAAANGAQAAATPGPTALPVSGTVAPQAAAAPAGATPTQAMEPTATGAAAAGATAAAVAVTPAGAALAGAIAALPAASDRARARVRGLPLGFVSAPEVEPSFRWQPALPRAKNGGINSIVLRMAMPKGSRAPKAGGTPPSAALQGSADPGAMVCGLGAFRV